MKSSLALLLIPGSMLGLALALPACGSSSKPATFSSLNQDVFQISCANFSSCHNKTDHKGGLDLQTDPYNALVNADTVGMDGNDDFPKARTGYPKRVVPGHPEQSYLWKKLTMSESHNADYGYRMPYNNPPLDQESLDRIETWITNGAQND